MTLLSDHCECSHPMVWVPTDDDVYQHGNAGNFHDPKRETWPGLARTLDGHHQPSLCGMCDGTESFDVAYHFEINQGIYRVEPSVCMIPACGCNGEAHP